jgi:predicted DNA-binding transcriptional regulator AlpA
LLRGVEVAARMGCSRALAYKLMKEGILPTVRIPGEFAPLIWPTSII